jgi:acetyl esterase/lipase
MSAANSRVTGGRAAPGRPGLSRRAALGLFGAMLTAGCSRVAFLAANVPATFGPYRRETNLAYGPDPQQQLDVYIPDVPVKSPTPLVIFWHGGRWSFGDKADYRFVGAALAQLGYVAVLPNYRMYPQVKMAGFMADAAQAALWSSANAAQLGADPKQLYLMGHSAGAHMAVLLSLDERYFAATQHPAPHIAGSIGLSGPYDFLPLLEPDVQDMLGPPARYADSQPINFVRAGAPRMLLVHGSKDDTVWPKNSRNLASALTARGVPVTLKFYPHVGHADTVAALSAPARGRAPTLADIADFVGRPPDQAA